jgi:hypothetical protein
MNIVLVLLLVALPLAGPGAFFVVLAIATTITAYHGPRSNVVYGCTALLLAIEMIYGLDLGMLSLAYLVAALLLIAFQRMIAFTPWKNADGWRLADALRTAGVAGGMFLLAVGIQLRGSWSVLWPTEAAWIAGVIVVCLIILRRFDVPFRKPIRFGI